MLSLTDATPQDIADITQIVNEGLSNPANGWRETALSEAEITTWLPGTADGKHVLRVISNELAVVGFGALGSFKTEPGYERTAELSVYVSKRAQRIGAGRMLMEDLLTPRPPLRVVLSSIDAENEASIKLHQLFGFAQVGFMRGVGHVEDRSRDLVLMQKDIR